MKEYVLAALLVAMGIMCMLIGNYALNSATRGGYERGTRIALYVAGGITYTMATLFVIWAVRAVLGGEPVVEPWSVN